jgi:hypothetical protein
MALNVNEAWLMGFDVPIERTSMPQSQNNSLLKALYESDLKNSIVAEEFVEYKVREQFNLDSYDYKLLKAFKKLSIEGKEEAINRITELSFIPKYINEEEC